MVAGRNSGCRFSSTSSKIWLNRQSRDAFVRRRSAEGIRSRSAYKLLEMDEKYHIFKGANVIVDLGAAPGGWSEMVVKRRRNPTHLSAPTVPGSRVRVVAVDILPMDPIPGVEFIQGSLLSPETYQALKVLLGGSPVDVVISDMCSNITGNRLSDSENSLELCRAAFEFAKIHVLAGHNSQQKGGNTNSRSGVLIMKYFDHPILQEFQQELKRAFHRVNVFKPNASRSESSERYFICRGRRQQGVGLVNKQM